MSIRSRARELAFKIFFAMDAGKNSLPDVATNFSYESPVAMDYALVLVKGVIEHLREIDEKIVSLLENWDFSRLAMPDKEILRLALFEIDYLDGSDPGAVVFDAVEIAKKYGTENSGEFVNGILRSYLRRKENAAQKA
ncbi:MAG: transcription antitermination factor NusB [Caldisericaceae bacterium]|nr:transcription antitermination factor NusB [Caldisericaceae bacterium]